VTISIFSGNNSHNQVTISTKQVTIPKIPLPSEEKLYLCGMKKGFLLVSLLLLLLSCQQPLEEVQQRIHKKKPDASQKAPGWYRNNMQIQFRFCWNDYSTLRTKRTERPLQRKAAPDGLRPPLDISTEAAIEPLLSLE
jgi:hypothetical protein